MDIQISYDYRETDVIGLLDIERLVSLVIEREGKPANSEVSITFVDDDEIHELNRTYRGIDRPTDVLSFECDGIEDGFGSPTEEEAYVLGDIVIAPDVAQRQARGYGLTFAEEMSLLITHGMLHLCGYDHIESEEAEVMEERERVVLSEFWARPFKRSSLDG